jgi:hypothetical protein
MIVLAVLRHIIGVLAWCFILYQALFARQDLSHAPDFRLSLLPFDFRKRGTRAFWLVVGLAGIAFEVHEIVTVGWDSTGLGGLRR